MYPDVCNKMYVFSIFFVFTVGSVGWFTSHFVDGVCQSLKFNLNVASDKEKVRTHAHPI